MNAKMNGGVKGFTLAEVLITLGIIGVVAALTLPSLIQNYKKQVASTKLKKFYSTMSQAIKLSEIDNGSISDWHKISNALNADDVMNNSKATKEFFDTYLFKYITTIKNVQENFNDEYSNTIVTFFDGSALRLHNGSCIDMNYYLNGIKKSVNASGKTFVANSVGGKDYFVFLLCPNGQIRGGNPYFGTYRISSYQKNDSRETVLSLCKTKTAYCSVLLEMDGWEFKDDYPHRL